MLRRTKRSENDVVVPKEEEQCTVTGLRHAFPLQYNKTLIK
jgi:hypothetical protein